MPLVRPGEAAQVWVASGRFGDQFWGAIRCGLSRRGRHRCRRSPAV